jgi:hypothetical protein
MNYALSWDYPVGKTDDYKALGIPDPNPDPDPDPDWDFPILIYHV